MFFQIKKIYQLICDMTGTDLSDRENEKLILNSSQFQDPKEGFESSNGNRMVLTNLMGNFLHEV